MNVEVPLSGGRTVEITFDWSGGWMFPVMLDLDAGDVAVINAVIAMTTAVITV